MAFLLADPQGGRSTLQRDNPQWQHALAVSHNGLFGFGGAAEAWAAADRTELAVSGSGESFSLHPKSEIYCGSANEARSSSIP